jgi:phosphoribosyl 1,2-cyclic phosphate phosphodiesterase
MKITFLGTGTSQGVPVIACQCDICKSTDSKDNRLRSSVLIQEGNTNLVIDSGPDFRQQMLRENVKTLDAILFTHEHKDHVAGLDDVRSYNYLQEQPMDIYAEKRVHEALKREFAYVFASYKYPGIPELRLNEIKPNGSFSVKDIEVTPIRVMHYKLPILGFQFNNFVYITDANYIDESIISQIKGTKILVVNALREKKHLSHFNLKEALEVIEKVNPEKAFLTHISHKFYKHNEISKLLPDNVHVAYDGLMVQI